MKRTRNGTYPTLRRFVADGSVDAVKGNGQVAKARLAKGNSFHGGCQSARFILAREGMVRCKALVFNGQQPLAVGFFQAVGLCVDIKANGFASEENVGIRDGLSQGVVQVNGQIGFVIEQLDLQVTN